MRWVKVANLPDCRSQINQLVEIIIPAELPSGNAIFRWDQYALHQVNNNNPFVEWFLQCADVKVESSSARAWDSFDTFSIIDNNGVPVYPSRVDKYRNPYTPGQQRPNEPDFFMTGPACVDETINNCQFTAVGTRGYTGFGGSAGTVEGIGSTTSPSSPSYSVTRGATRPVQTSPTTSQGSMCCYAGGCASYGGAGCNAVGAWCSETSDHCNRCGGVLCSGPDGTSERSEPESESEPESTPEAEPEAEPKLETASEGAPEPAVPSPSVQQPQCCHGTGCGANAVVYCHPADSWCSQSVEICGSCNGIFCSEVALLLRDTAKKHRFLRRHEYSGNNLLQKEVESKKSLLVGKLGDEL